jgi:hypothetical protein
MAKIWDDEEVSEYDLIKEDAEQAEELAEEYAAQPSVVEADQDELDEISDESAFELTNTESNVIYNARLRLEQAKLYELLINHNLFEGVDASEQAIKNVQNELKFYIVKRLEILLGIREQVVRTESTAVAAEPQFNEVEADFLKQLAYKGTFGQSKESEPARIVAPKMAIKPVSSPAQKLKAMTTPKKVEVKQAAPAPTPKAPVKQATPPVKKIVEQAPAKQTVPVTKKPAAPPKKEIKSGIAPRNLTNDEVLEIARADLKTASKKPFHEMNAKEKAAKIAEVNERNKRPAKVAGAIPMPNENQLFMKYTAQQENMGGSRDQTKQFNSMLASALAAKKTRGDYDDGE